MLGSEYFDWELTSNEGNEIGDRVRLQESIDGRRELVEAGFILPRGVRDRLNFWEGGGNVVFPKRICPEYHYEGRQQFRGCGGIIPSSDTSDDTRYLIVGGRHGGASVNVDGEFK